ncbi:MAG: DUF1801 domain-containing protein [Pirellulales bacterium]|nr:DUF1801 domain-containing protein [Pirellulales bacterium]
MQSSATTVEAYLKSLPADRRRAVEAVRRVILDNLDSGFAEGMQYGMIGYYVPHSVYPPGYHCNPKQPLPLACLASQKNYLSLYLMSVYGDGPHWDWFHKAWAKTGKKLNMGKCCIRFQRAEDLALDVIAEALRRTSAAAYIANYERVLGQMRSRPKRGPTAEKPSAKTPSAKSTTRAAAKRKATKRQATKTTVAKSTPKKTAKAPVKKHRVAK